MILTIVTAFFRILFSAVFGVIFGLAGKEVLPFYMALIYVSELVMIFSMPISIAIEYEWIRRRAKGYDHVLDLLKNFLAY